VLKVLSVIFSLKISCINFPDNIVILSGKYIFQIISKEPYAVRKFI
jgi:hypothetical protein